MPPHAEPAGRNRRREFMLAALVGAAFAASPLSGAARLGPSLVGGALVAGAFFWLRRDRTQAAPPARVPTFAWIVLALVALVLAPTAGVLFDWYSDSVWRNAHGMLLPLVIAGLAVRVLRRHAGEPVESSAWGYPFLGVGVALILIDTGVQTVVLSVLAICAILLGLSLLLLGERRTWALRLPLGLTLFFLPLPTVLAGPLGLQLGSAIGAERVLDVMGMPALRMGIGLELEQHSYAVSANCSGFSALYAGLLAAVVLGAHCSGWWRACLLLVSVWPLAVGVNALREASLIAICEVAGIQWLHSPLHGISGILTVFAVIGALLVFAGRDSREATFA